MQSQTHEVAIWDKWNSTYRVGRLDEPSKRRLREINAMMDELNIKGANILEAGCGTGWLSNALSQFGQVTGVDLGKDILDNAQKEYPQVRFISGSIYDVDLPENSFDVVVTSETFSHVPDQPAFLHRLGRLLKTNGYLLITTQNKTVFDRTGNVAPPDGWIRNWVTMKTLKNLLRAEFDVKHATTLEPTGRMGMLRVVNSTTLNHYCNAALGAERVKRLKESAGFGQSLFVVAVKR